MTFEDKLQPYKLTELEGLMLWANELSAVFKNDNPNAVQWAMVGRAVVLIAPDDEAALRLSHQVAITAGIQLVCSTGEELQGHLTSTSVPENWLDALVFIPSGEWSATSNDVAISKFQADIAGFLHSLSPDIRFTIVTSAREYVDLSEVLRQEGAFDRRIFLPPLSMKQIGNRFLSELGCDLCDESLLQRPEKVGRIIDSRFDTLRKQGLLKVAMRRIANREGRQLRMADLINFSANGTHDYATRKMTRSNEENKRTAYHEAGHALVSMINSDGLNIPEYVSIISNHYSKGLVIESFSMPDWIYQRETLDTALHSIQISLAGRAAEEVVYGALHVGRHSSESDLAKATMNAKNLVARCGLSSETMITKRYDNLSVISSSATSSEEANIEVHARKILATQYQIVLKTLQKHRLLLDVIAQRLMENDVLLQEDLLSLWKEAKGNAIRPKSCAG